MRAEELPDKVYIAADNDLFSHEYAIEPYESVCDVCYVRKDALIENALDLINAVEKYVRQDCSRSTLIWKKEKLKRLIEE